MKRIELYIGSAHLVIDECEGEAQIRHVDQPRSMAGRRTDITVKPWGAQSVTLNVKVERSE